MSGNKGLKAYPMQVNLEAVRLFFEEGKTRAEITKVLGLSRVSIGQGSSRSTAEVVNHCSQANQHHKWN